ncbi:MAG: hypothetical protein H0W13_05590 [Nitrospirales bacterium]|nr:hypothetical protein [Nitrospirales bacterium]
MKVWFILLLLGLVPELALAGEIRGAVLHGGKSVGQGVDIEVRCGTNLYSTVTDKYGSYRLFLPENGTCRLQIKYQSQTPSREIVSFDDSTRYDLTLEKDGDQYVLRRK